MSEYLVSMPFKLGDALWALPVAKQLSKLRGQPVDFATSVYCKPLHRLVAYQPFVDKLHVDVRFDNIVQGRLKGYAWNSIVPFEGYKEQHHLRFTSFPMIHIPQFYANQVGVALDEPMRIRGPALKDRLFDHYIVLNYNPGRSLGRSSIPDFKEVCQEILKQSEVPVVQIGQRDEALVGGMNCCGMDMFDTAAILQGADYLISTPSANPVLASLLGVPQRLAIPRGFMPFYLKIFFSLGDVHIHMPEDYSTAATMAVAMLAP